MSWFRKVGWVYVPVAVEGWLVAAVTAAACAWVFWAVDRKSHSVSDTLIGTFPYVTCFLVWFGWVAGNTSQTVVQPE